VSNSASLGMTSEESQKDHFMMTAIMALPCWPASADLLLHVRTEGIAATGGCAFATACCLWYSWALWHAALAAPACSLPQARPEPSVKRQDTD